MVIELNFTIQIEVFNAFKTIFDTVAVVGVASCTLICQTVQSPVAVGPPHGSTWLVSDLNLIYPNGDLCHFLAQGMVSPKWA